MLIEEFGSVAIPILERGGAVLDIKTLLDIMDLRRYRDAKAAAEDPKIKDEDIPLAWMETYMMIQAKKLGIGDE